MPPVERSSSWIELSSRALANNITAFRTLLGADRKLGAVLKGNAYGHGLEPMLGLIHSLVDVLYVIMPAEAAQIRAWERSRRLPPKPVLVLGMITPLESEQLADDGVAVVAGGPELSAVSPHLRARGKRLDVQIHLDTGLGREGFTPAQLAAGAADFLKADHDVLTVRGALTHFSNTEDVTEQDYARQQLATFDAGLVTLSERLGLTNLERHSAASAAALVLPPSRLDVARIGISLYGLWPSAETRLSARVVLGSVPTLEPVLSWRAMSQTVKLLDAGSYVGYGCSWKATTTSRIAVFPLGYWDGYPRLVSGKAHVIVNGRRCPVIGRVMMNHIIVDVTHATSNSEPVRATLLGRDGDEVITAELLASWAQTIHYEIVTRLGAHLPRVIVD